MNPQLKSFLFGLGVAALVIACWFWAHPVKPVEVDKHRQVRIDSLQNLIRVDSIEISHNNAHIGRLQAAIDSLLQLPPQIVKTHQIKRNEIIHYTAHPSADAMRRRFSESHIDTTR